VVSSQADRAGRYAVTKTYAVQHAWGTVMLETDRRNLFYHGTQIAIHKLSEPFLDPKFARHCDEGDPQEPHVFVTLSRPHAQLFSLKVQEAVMIHEGEGGGTIVYSQLPKDLRGGWLYTCVEDPQYPFRQIVARGHSVDKWVSSKKVAIMNPVFIPGLRFLARQGVKIYLLKEGMDPEIWSEIMDDTDGAQLGSSDFYHQQVKMGNLRYLNIR
jgi:hypothetical protein